MTRLKFYDYYGGSYYSLSGRPTRDWLVWNDFRSRLVLNFFLF